VKRLDEMKVFPTTGGLRINRQGGGTMPWKGGLLAGSHLNGDKLRYVGQRQWTRFVFWFVWYLGGGASPGWLRKLPDQNFGWDAYHGVTKKKKSLNKGRSYKRRAAVWGRGKEHPKGPHSVKKIVDWKMEETFFGVVGSPKKKRIAGSGAPPS